MAAPKERTVWPRLSSLDDYYYYSPAPQAGGGTCGCSLRSRLHGMEHLHSLTPPILHRDLAARNILIAVTVKGLMAN